MTVEEVACFLNVHPKTVGRWIKEGTLRENNMVTEEALLEWLSINAS